MECGYLSIKGLGDGSFFGLFFLSQFVCSLLFLKGLVYVLFLYLEKSDDKAENLFYLAIVPVRGILSE